MAIIKLGSDVIRKKWVLANILRKTEQSRFTAMTGSTFEAVIMQATNTKAADGHTVVHQGTAPIPVNAIEGDTEVRGRGTRKFVFSNKQTVKRYRLPVYNDSEFDSVNIGDLSLTQHQDSMNLLASAMVKFKDQGIFDSLQGNLGQSPTHIYKITGGDFTFHNLLDLEKLVKTNVGFDTGSMRRPLSPYITKDGQQCWLLLVDPTLANLLRKDPKYQSLVYNADVRGNNNRAIKGVFGKLGSLIILEQPVHYGHVDGDSISLQSAKTEMAGMRQYDRTNNKWTGENGFDFNSNLTSRALLVGSGAIQIAFGKQPDYLYEEPRDLGDTNSASALEVWFDIQKVRFQQERAEYEQAKLSGVDFGVIAVDVEL